ncbi:N-acetyltransferase [Chryseobacterium lactis]|uniref:N-acetyltransferase n=1 Tax=Chryseobacterium lactis TaxID=1241981 RepID=A0A3G6RLG1_CHRLC|nr:GNAT family N-acetyltransferase [Chryseobacterium lactis]AZA84719.1 N-acetyltransferase [Chryseobacterium lactis]AZB05108.1 N-acetyltransferase [Chryseobacterium lactis]PNW12090.1 N-acetyltransferase [Chryseobacterium lactis]
MEIKTERFVLKEIDESYVEDILRIRSNEVINQYVKRKSPKTNYDALEFILTIKKKTQNREILFFGISYQNQRNLIGTICLWKFSEDRKTAEVGYELLPDYHQRGIMGEALKSVLDYGFNTLKLQEVRAYTHKNNNASQQLLLKQGFVVKEGAIDEGNLDNIIFTLNKLKNDNIER